MLGRVLFTHRAALGLTRLSRRGTLAVAYLVLQAVLALLTYGTSVGRHFTSGAVTVGWAALLVVLVVIALPDLRGAIGNIPVDLHPFAATRAALRRLGIENGIWLIPVAFIIGVLAYLGWSFRPSNGDSLVYHLVRVEHWIQGRSVTYFPTHYLAQLELSPLAEYNLAHMHLLAGSDRLDGFVQLFACVISLVAVSEIARLLGGSNWVQVVAVVICVTIPSGVLAATSTENDYFAASIGVCLLVAVLAWPRDGHWWFPSMILGLGVGLGYLAKGTIPPLIFPVIAAVLIFQFFRGISRHGALTTIRRWIAVVGLSIVGAGVVAAPFISQNVQLYGSAVGPVSKSTLSVDLTATAAGANVVRSTAANFMIGNGKGDVDARVSTVALSGFRWLFDRFHVSPTDQRYVLGTQTNAFLTSDYSQWDRSGDAGANPWDVLLICGSVLLLLIARFRGDRSVRLPLLVAAGLIVGYVVFCGTTRWSVFNIRYQIPLYVAWSPIVAIAITRLPRMITRIMLVLLILACTPQLFSNVEEPFLHHDYPASSLAPYFLDTNVQAYVQASAGEYQAASSAMAQSSCHQLGLANWIFVEYPLWPGLRNAGWHGQIQDIDVMNVSSRFANKGFAPCGELRQEPASYSGEPGGNVQLRFGPLALSLEPKDAATIRTPVTGFKSMVGTVRVLPGSGWLQPDPPGGNSRLVQTGSVFLFASSAQSVTLAVTAIPPAVPAPVYFGAPSGALPSASTSPSDKVTLHLARGVTRVTIRPTSLAAASSITGVEVAPAAQPG